MANQIYDDLKARLSFFDDPNWGKYDVVEKGLIVASQSTTAALGVYRKLRGTSVDQSELSAAIKQFHDEVIAPLDLPGVGPWAEPFIDGQFGTILGGLVTPINAGLDKVLPKPGV